MLPFQGIPGFVWPLLFIKQERSTCQKSVLGTHEHQRTNRKHCPFFCSLKWEGDRIHSDFLESLPIVHFPKLKNESGCADNTWEASQPSLGGRWAFGELARIHRAPSRGWFGTAACWCKFYVVQVSVFRSELRLWVSDPAAQAKNKQAWKWANGTTSQEKVKVWCIVQIQTLKWPDLRPSGNEGQSWFTPVVLCSWISYPCILRSPRF